jgi:hypothetical protein
MLNRRQFLVGAGRSLGAWLVAPRIAQLIYRMAEEDGEPYLVEVDRPQHVLWVTLGCDDYILSLDHPYIDNPPQLTWKQWLERKSVDVSKPDEIRDFLTEWGWFDPDEGQPWAAPDLNAELPDRLLNNYLDWEWVISDGPEAKAYHYLGGLGLADRKGRGDGLGLLEFVNGPHPGCNCCLVTTRSIAVLGGLQQRLLQLGERVNICTDAI